jgi:dTMP kinase
MARVTRLLVTFSGVDGSGKSTLAHALIEQFASEGVPTEYLWWFAANDSFLGKVVGSVVQKIAKPEEDETKGLPKVGFVRALYQLLVLVDFLLRVWYSSILGKNIVCDRYIYDIVVFFATELCYSESEAQKLVRLLKSITPEPLVAFLVDVPARIAMQRKSDIPSSQRHERLRKLYLDLAKGDSTVTFVDGSKGLEELNQAVFAEVFSRLSSVTRR